MKYLLQRIWFSLLLLLFAVPVAAYDFPPLTDRVVDQANLLSPQFRAELVARLKAHEDKTTNQIVVVTINSLGGYSIEQYGVELGRAWGIGQKLKNNGVVLLIAPQERKMRIEVGYGLEGTLTDALCSIIIDRRLRPAFKRGDFAVGIQSGVEGIISILNSEMPEDLKKSATADFSEVVLPMLFFPFLISFLLSPFIRGKNAFFPAVFFGIIGGSIAGIVASSLLSGSTLIVVTTALLIGIIVGVVFFVLIYLNIWNGVGVETLGGRRPPLDGGGFSGGGGSFGGGGASGNW